MDCPSCAVGARGRAEAGPLGPGLSGRRRWRAPSAALEPASRGPELACGAQGARGRSASPRRALRSVTVLDFLSGFFLLKKERNLVSTGSVCGSCCAAAGRGGQTERALEAPRRRLLGERRIVRGSGWGAVGPALLPPPCLFSREQMAPYAGCGKGGGSTGTLGVRASLWPSIPQRMEHRAIGLCLAHGALKPGS